VTGIFRTLTAGFSRFVLAWMVPSFTTVALFAVFVFGEMDGLPVLESASKMAGRGNFEASVLIVSFGVLVALISAFTALPMTRILEGYQLPGPLARWFRRRQLRRQLRLRRMALHYLRRGTRAKQRYLLLAEELEAYPDSPGDLMPTRLGNAYKSAEVYGDRKYQLDSQTLWHEIISVAPDRLCRSYEDAQAQIDFFLGFVSQFTLLALVSVLTAVGSEAPGLLVLAAVLLILSRLAYLGAVRNMGEVRSTIQALVNVTRPALANTLGYKLPPTLEKELEFWEAWMDFIGLGVRESLKEFDEDRRRYVDKDLLPSDAPPSSPL
jgi:hypothetical protein